MANESTINRYLRVCSLLEVVGFVLHTVGFATPYWRAMHFKYSSDVRGSVDVLIQGFDEGLWRRCINGICSDVNVVGRDWIQAVRVFECIAVVLSSMATLFIVLYFMFPKFAENKRLFITTIAMCLATGMSIMLASITYGASVKDNISWSYGLIVTGGLFYVIVGVLMIILHYTLMAKPY